MYGFSAFTDAYGCTVAWTDATGVLGNTCQQGWTDQMAYVGGGTSTSTGYPAIDEIMSSTNSAIVTTWLSPTCIHTIAGVCYT